MEHTYSSFGGDNMKFDLGKWGVPLGAVFTALATIVTDSVLDTSDIVTLVTSLVGLVGTVAAGIKSYNTVPTKTEE